MNPVPTGLIARFKFYSVNSSLKNRFTIALDWQSVV